MTLGANNAVNRYWSFIKQNGRPLTVLAAVFITVLLSAVFIGQPALKSCLWALLLVVFSGIVSILPVVRDAHLTSTVSISCAIFSIAVRLLTMLVGATSILFLTRISVLYFVLWLAILYSTMITVEVLIIISLINTNKKHE